MSEERTSKRMTYKDGRGRYTILVNGVELHGKVVNRLAAYEDTGFEPEEIKEWRIGQSVFVDK